MFLIAAHAHAHDTWQKKKLFLWASASIVPSLPTVSIKSCPFSSRWLIAVGGGGGSTSSSGSGGGGGGGDTE